MSQKWNVITVVLRVWLARLTMMEVQSENVWKVKKVILFLKRIWNQTPVKESIVQQGRGLFKIFIKSKKVKAPLLKIFFNRIFSTKQSKHNIKYHQGVWHNNELCEGQVSPNHSQFRYILNNYIKFNESTELSNNGFKVGYERLLQHETASIARNFQPFIVWKAKFTNRFLKIFFFKICFSYFDLIWFLSVQREKGKLNLQET